MPTPELLAPAGNLEKLRAALFYGANAVYLGGESFNLRAAASGFSLAELREALRLAEGRRAKIYYCLNSFPYENELPSLPPVIEEAAQAGVHGFIVADPGVFSLVRKYAPGVEIHVSTQANTTNSQSVAFWAGLGASRVNLARELPGNQILALREACPDVELEVFVHGAMCLALSGQCLLSAWLNGRPANKGRCTHPCRFDYRATGCAGKNADCVARGLELGLEECTRPGEELWRASAEEGYAAVWAPQELCLLPYLPWFCRNGINSLKLEGRMKGAAYVAHVVDVYSSALKTVVELGARAEAEFAWEPGLAELLSVAARPLGTGFFLPEGRRNFTEELLQPGENGRAEYANPVLARVSGGRAGKWELDVMGRWPAGSDVELMLPGLRRPLLRGRDYELENYKGEKAEAVNSGLTAVLHADAAGLEAGVFIRTGRGKAEA